MHLLKSIICVFIICLHSNPIINSIIITYLTMGKEAQVKFQGIGVQN